MELLESRRNIVYSHPPWRLLLPDYSFYKGERKTRHKDRSKFHIPPSLLSACTKCR